MTETSSQQKNRKTFRGTVVGANTKDTIMVLVEDYVKHPRYGKYMNRRKRYPVHSPENTYTVGSKVVIEECRPISKTKKFRVVSGETAEVAT